MPTEKLVISPRAEIEISWEEDEKLKSLTLEIKKIKRRNGRPFNHLRKQQAVIYLQIEDWDDLSDEEKREILEQGQEFIARRFYSSASFSVKGYAPISFITKFLESIKSPEIELANSESDEFAQGDEITSLINLLRKRPSITTSLDLEGREIGSALALELLTQENLRKLNLSNNEITDIERSSETKISRKLHELNFCKNKIGSNFIFLLASSLIDESCKMKLLILHGNEITDENAVILAEALMTNSSLQFLDLSNNKIGSKTIKALADSLQKNKSLKQLYLEENNLEAVDVNALLQSLSKNNSLETLNLSKNSANQETINLICKIFREEKNLREFSLQEMNYVTTEQYPEFNRQTAILQIAEALKGNLTINSFDIGEDISDAEKMLFSEVLFIQEIVRSSFGIFERTEIPDFEPIEITDENVVKILRYEAEEIVRQKKFIEPDEQSVGTPSKQRTGLLGTPRKITPSTTPNIGLSPNGKSPVKRLIDGEESPAKYTRVG